MATHVSETASQQGMHALRSVVAGVEPNGRGVSAVVWAVREAELDDTSVSLVSARSGDMGPQDPLGEHDLGTLARSLTLAAVQQRQVVGESAAVLLEEATRADLLVVGRRTGRTGQSLLLGSTSRAVARWSPVPVVVVPEAWIQPGMASSPILAAVRPWDPDTAPGTAEPEDAVLDFAFRRATSLKVPLLVVNSWEIPSLYAWSPPDIERVRSFHADTMTARLASWRQLFPGVEVVAHSVAHKPAQAVLEASAAAQLVVVGRHHGAATLTGTLGRTTSHILRHSSRPVAVVPHGARADLVRELSARRVVVDRLWAPSF